MGKRRRGEHLHALDEHGVEQHQHDVEAGPHEKEEDHQEGGRHDLWRQGAVVSTCMLRRILKKADAITRKPIAISRNQTQSVAIRRADAHHQEADRGRCVEGRGVDVGLAQRRPAKRHLWGKGEREASS